jgi:hypothetical protein
MILPFRQRTKEHHDTMRQISRSETLSGLNEMLRHITRAQQPEYWFHHCEEYQGKNIRMEVNQPCPCCFVDQWGHYHREEENG